MSHLTWVVSFHWMYHNCKYGPYQTLQSAVSNNNSDSQYSIHPKISPPSSQRYTTGSYPRTVKSISQLLSTALWHCLLLFHLFLHLENGLLPSWFCHKCCVVYSICPTDLSLTATITKPKCRNQDKKYCLVSAMSWIQIPPIVLAFVIQVFVPSLVRSGKCWNGTVK
jgi:hypothetical protein